MYKQIPTNPQKANEKYSNLIKSNRKKSVKGMLTQIRYRSFTEIKENGCVISNPQKKRAMLQQPKQGDTKRILATTIVLERKEDEEVAEETFPHTFMHFKDKCDKESKPVSPVVFYQSTH